MINHRVRRPALFLAIVALIAGGIVVAPTAASAQGGAVDQYGGTGPAGGSGGDEPGDVIGAGAGGESAGTAESGGGDLPFTGYPLTPLAVTFLLLLAAGVVIRVASSSRTDVASSRSGPRLR